MRDRTGKLLTPDSHVDNEYGTKTMIYKREKRKERKRKKKREKGREVEEIQQKERKNPKPLIILLGYNRGCFLYLCMCNSFSLTLSTNIFSLDSD